MPQPRGAGVGGPVSPPQTPSPPAPVLARGTGASGRVGVVLPPGLVLKHKVVVSPGLPKRLRFVLRPETQMKVFSRARVPGFAVPGGRGAGQLRYVCALQSGTTQLFNESLDGVCTTLNSSLLGMELKRAREWMNIHVPFPERISAAGHWLGRSRSLVSVKNFSSVFRTNKTAETLIFFFFF